MIMPLSKNTDNEFEPQPQNTMSDGQMPSQKPADPPMLPPSYEYATGSDHRGYPQQPPTHNELPAEANFPPYPYKSKQPAPQGGVPVYYYENPRTGRRITTFLPPDHPEMVCLQEGRHYTKSRFGLLGILAAVVWFPVGIVCCLVDRRVTCRRCKRILDGGFYSC